MIHSCEFCSAGNAKDTTPFGPGTGANWRRFRAPGDRADAGIWLFGYGLPDGSVITVGCAPDSRPEKLPVR